MEPIQGQLFISITNLAPNIGGVNTLGNCYTAAAEQSMSKLLLHTLFSCMCITITKLLVPPALQGKVGDAVGGVNQ